MVDGRRFSNFAPTTWNSLPFSLRCIEDTPNFKKMLKNHLYSSFWSFSSLSFFLLLFTRFSFSWHHAIICYLSRTGAADWCWGVALWQHMLRAVCVCCSRWPFVCVSLQWMLVSLTTEFTIGVSCDPESRAIGFPPGRGFREDRNSTIVKGRGSAGIAVF